MKTHHKKEGYSRGGIFIASRDCASRNQHGVLPCLGMPNSRYRAVKSCVLLMTLE